MPSTIPNAAVPVLTNPLSLYRSLVSTKRIEPDPSQHRLAIHLQKLYHRLIDYSPQINYGPRLRAISKVYENKTYIQDDGEQLAVPGHPIWNNPLFSHLFSRKNHRDSLALTRVLTDYEEAMKLQSPQGLLVHGEVGSGKSMLVDLLANGLPSHQKKKWHFNAFMLEILARLEQYRRSCAMNKSKYTEFEYSLLWLAKDMIEKSPILFLDEFQLPDRAASKIISQLLTAFFQLGGVLIATSNRMPDELSKSSGIVFTTSSTEKTSSNQSTDGSDSRTPTTPTDNEYSGFIDVLKARCEIWNMEGERDWRRREAEEMARENLKYAEKVNEYSNFFLPTNSVREKESNDTFKNASPVLPQKYFLISTNSERDWQDVLRTAIFPENKSQIVWHSETLAVYARKVTVPRHLNGVTYWKFPELCGGPLGPADYITLTSKFHTFIIDEVPVLNLSEKNEARRLITLLDALYEARCKLILRAEVGPDNLFFPELSSSSALKSTSSEIEMDYESNPAAEDDRDTVYSETIAEIYQDKNQPFRPNISSYSNDSQSAYNLSIIDSTFDPISTQETSNNNKTQKSSKIDFTLTSSFTGEDERFAYKRARSRLWEMCGARWHARSDPNWWQPLPADVRSWESSSSSHIRIPLKESTVKSEIKMGEFVELDRPAGLQGQEFTDSSLQYNSCQCKK